MATINGTTSDDILNGVTGLVADDFYGDTGIDEVSYATATSSVTVNLRTLSGSGNTGEAYLDRYFSIEKFRLSSHDDLFRGSNSTGAYNWASGMDGSDKFYSGGAGTNNIFWAGTGNDSVYGSAGTTTSRMGDGNDSHVGGTGIDNMYGDGGDDYFKGGDGKDYAVGGTGADNLNGDAGVDTLRGGDDNDTISGGADGDFLYGEAGNDYINGGTGSDWIQGGSGSDSLRGGGADGVKDQFVFDSADTGSDYIWDFEDNIDVLRFSGATTLSDLVASVNGNGNTVITNQLSGATIEIRDVSWQNLQDDILFV